MREPPQDRIFLDGEEMIVTPATAEDLREAERELAAGETISFEEYLRQRKMCED